MKINKHFPKGLTLIELLIVVLIIMLVMSIGGNTYRDQRKHVIYNDSVLKVINLIKTARSYALTSRTVYDECAGPGNEMYVPAEGYGVYLFRSSVPGQSRAVLFANTEIDNEGERNRFQEFAAPCSSDMIEEDFTIPVDVDFVGLWTDKAQPAHTGIGGGAPDKATIIFRPPLAEATITVNDVAPVLTYLNELYVQFRRPDSPSSIPSQYIYFNRIAGFPEIEKE